MRHAIVATAVAVGLVGCGGGDEQQQPTAPPTGGGMTLQLEADPGGALSFDKKTLSADAGTVTLVMDNPSDVQHNVALEGSGVDEKGKVVGKGGTSRVSAQVKPGKYTFYCSVPGHREGGMHGTLTVK